MRRILSLSGLVVSLAMPPTSAAQSDVTGIARNATPAVVTIRTFDASGTSLGTGSGFFLSDQRVVTNAHVLNGAARAEVYDHQNQLVGSVTHAEALSESVDLAVLPRLPLAVGALDLVSSMPEVGSRVVAIGAPRGLSNTVSEGIVSAVRDFEGRRLIQITAPISQGSSGGPVLDLSGRVVGISVGLLRDGQNLNFAIPARDAIALSSSPSGQIAFPRAQAADDRAASRRVNEPSAATLRESIHTNVEELPFGRLVTDQLRGGGDLNPLYLYRFDGRAGETVSLRVSSVEFDVVVDLFLVSADSLEEVASDDDGALGLDAQLSVRLPRNGTYLVNVRGVDGLSGESFRIIANRGSSPPRYSDAERYVLVYSGRDQLYLVDRKTMNRTPDGNLRVWIEHRYRSVQSADGIRYETVTVLYDLACRTRRSRYLEGVYYLDGSLVEPDRRMGTWQNWVPGSVGEIGWGAACAMARQMGVLN